MSGAIKFPADHRYNIENIKKNAFSKLMKVFPDLRPPTGDSTVDDRHREYDSIIIRYGGCHIRVNPNGSINYVKYNFIVSGVDNVVDSTEFYMVNDTYGSSASHVTTSISKPIKIERKYTLELNRGDGTSSVYTITMLYYPSNDCDNVTDLSVTSAQRAYSFTHEIISKPDNPRFPFPDKFFALLDRMLTMEVDSYKKDYICYVDYPYVYSIYIGSMYIYVRFDADEVDDIADTSAISAISDYRIFYPFNRVVEDNDGHAIMGRDYIADSEVDVSTINKRREILISNRVTLPGEPLPSYTRISVIGDDYEILDEEYLLPRRNCKSANQLTR